MKAIRVPFIRMEWQMKKPLEILLDHAVGVLIAASGITGVLSFLIADAAKVWQERPAVMILTVLASFLAGILVACCLGAREAVRDEKKAEYERRVAQEQEAAAQKAEEERLEAEHRAKKKRREAYLCREVRQMDFMAKCFLAAVYERGSRLYAEYWESNVDLYETTADVRRCELLVGETAEDGMVYRLTDDGRAFLDRHPELLSTVYECFERKDSFDGDHL